MKAKLGGIVFALVLLGFGGHMLISPAEYTNIDTSEMHGRRSGIKKLLASGVNAIGPIPSGLILVGAGALVGFLTFKSTGDE